jgi:DNA ligase-associated metallophosphoesterase
MNWLKVSVVEEDLALGSEKCIYLSKDKYLLLSDLHIGKEAHFRKSGIALPAYTQNKTLERLESILKEIEVEKVIFLGDLFHSSINSSFILFKEFLGKFSKIKFILVQGNHEIYKADFYKSMGLETLEKLCIKNLVLSHEPVKVDDGKLNICGHIHPAVKLKGFGRQYIKVDCFYYDGNSLILPPFGEFTGNFIIKPKSNDKVWAVFDNSVKDISNLI